MKRCDVRKHVMYDARTVVNIQDALNTIVQNPQTMIFGVLKDNLLTHFMAKLSFNLFKKNIYNFTI